MKKKNNVTSKYNWNSKIFNKYTTYDSQSYGELYLHTN